MTRHEIEQKLADWLVVVDGTSIEAEDASNYAQCFDLAFNWCDYLGIPRDSIRHLHAYQIFTDPNPDTTNYWDMIVNTPTGVPLPGDLIIWGTLVGVSGHVATFKEGDMNSFRSEDQNWAGVQRARQVNHTYNGVLGWLSPKVKEPVPPTPESLPEPNPGYPATFAGMTVQQNGMTYRSYEQEGKFLWTVEQSAPVEQPTPEVVSPPVEIPVEVTTTGDPVVPVSTQGTSSATNQASINMPIVTAQPPTGEHMIKPSFTFGQLIAYILLKIKSVLKGR